MYVEQFLEEANNTIGVNGLPIINKFFVIFSRFECALKQSITFANGQHEGRVEANWDSFVGSIAGTFNPDSNTELKKAVDYIISAPPKKQSIDRNTDPNNPKLIWQDRVFGNEPMINRLCLSIRDIRNNLFHGGKFRGDYEPDVSRNYILLSSAMVILEEWLSLSQQVRNEFLAHF